MIRYSSAGLCEFRYLGDWQYLTVEILMMKKFVPSKPSALDKLFMRPITSESRLLVKEHHSYNNYMLVDQLDRDDPPRLLFNSLELDVRSFGPGWTVWLEGRDVFFVDMIELMDSVDDFSRQMRRMPVVNN